jgi:hypothetical protein
MPTTLIETPLTDGLFEREVAKNLSFWWQRQGVHPSHVITRFTTLSADRVYSGPFPFSHSAAVPAAAFAFVTCTLSEERDADFRLRYATEVRRLLRERVPPDRIVIAIQPTDPRNHFTPGSDTWHPVRSDSHE